MASALQQQASGRSARLHAGSSARSSAPLVPRALLSSSVSSQQQPAMLPLQPALTHSGFRGAAAPRSAGNRSRSSSSRASMVCSAGIKDGEKLDRPLRVAVVGGGPSGSCTAETLAKGGVETFLIERKMDNCKVGGWWAQHACARVRAGYRWRGLAGGRARTVSEKRFPPSRRICTPAPRRESRRGVRCVGHAGRGGRPPMGRNAGVVLPL